MRKTTKIIKVLGIDFETANRSRTSPCSMGLALLDAATGELIESKHFLINPHQDFDSFNVRIHGITPEMVADAPSFEEILSELAARIDANTLVVAHNSSFDMSVLQRTCEALEITPPDMEFVCTCVLSRILFPNLEKNTLTAVSKACGLAPFDHHYAEDDAITSARIFCHFLKYADSAYDLVKKAGITVGHFKNGYFKTCHHAGYAEPCPIEITPCQTNAPSPHASSNDGISAKVIGSLVKNDDGTDRQEILASLHAGDALRLCVTGNPADGTVAIFDAQNRQCGILHKRIVDALHEANADIDTLQVCVSCLETNKKGKLSCTLTIKV